MEQKKRCQGFWKKLLKISGIKYDISSYADIIDAIHVVQEEMDITGTTAKEASTTIEGSVNMTKSAWSNLVTGIADDNQDFNVLVDNFVTSASTAATNILPRIEIAINGIGTLIETLLLIIVNRIPEIINTVLPKLITSGMNMLQAIVTGLQQKSPPNSNGSNADHESICYNLYSNVTADYRNGFATHCSVGIRNCTGTANVSTNYRRSDASDSKHIDR